MRIKVFSGMLDRTSTIEFAFSKFFKDLDKVDILSVTPVISGSRIVITVCYIDLYK